MIDPDFCASSSRAVVIEKGPWQFNGADGIEVDHEGVLLSVVLVGLESDDGAEGAVSDIRVAVTLGIEVPVGCSSRDSVADGEATFGNSERKD